MAGEHRSRDEIQTVVDPTIDIFTAPPHTCWVVEATNIGFTTERGDPAATKLTNLTTGEVLGCVRMIDLHANTGERAVATLHFFHFAHPTRTRSKDPETGEWGPFGLTLNEKADAEIAKLTKLSEPRLEVCTQHDRKQEEPATDEHPA